LSIQILTIYTKCPGTSGAFFLIIYSSFEAMWAICKKEWTQYFSGLTGYLIIGFYLIANGLFLFVLPNYNVFDAGYTSLQVYFDFAPWFLLLLVPAITMRSFSEEYKQGTFELLRTLPIRSNQLVGAKFLGAFLIILFLVYTLNKNGLEYLIPL
jgi:ABC-type transport system involved in multi-copper enzyme maturation permease subunit